MQQLNVFYKTFYTTFSQKYTAEKAFHYNYFVKMNNKKNHKSNKTDVTK